MPKQRTLAEEIAQSANKTGRYPKVPRIPIQIELKDYAQWFGKRGIDEPCGILTYLTRKIEFGVEETVYSGTLKRAFASQSWLVVFDGLDEVPHNVKDAVATEVCAFVHNIQTECQADLLTICTSRPQGYSGQFSALDNSTIQLVELTPDQALLCAAPVLQQDRTHSESQQYMAALTAAIKSESVRELMTTPLQSHIMAVVVRDGGPPPERRWQLFQNFYQVIKKREANRNLPDPAISKLLREDSLLKTLHNRLGFVLHSRGETSKGAQTNLARSEFYELAKEAASQMLEEGPEDYVDALMSSATDRLVLVNTPETGEHVRFDVRQLQEFFAAEFLYKSVDADGLRLRLEVIAGDSHWREVMHFLLSALIENDRGTELSVAIQVLLQLDQSENEPDLRLLYRRLGRGALLVARLLNEGVLEQDKRIRGQFRTCLEPLYSFTDIAALSDLIDVSHANSLIWLCNVLSEALKEVHYSENIGAAIVLTYILPDNHQRVAEIRDYLLSSPPHYLSTIINRRSQEDGYDSEYSVLAKPLQKWLVEVLLDLLSEPAISNFDSNFYGLVTSLLQKSIKETIDVARHKGYTDQKLIFLEYFLLRSNDIETNNHENYGMVTGKVFEHDWTTGTFDNWVPALADTDSMTGLMQLALNVIRFAYDPTPKNMRNVMSILRENGINYLYALPIHIRAYFPFSGTGEFNVEGEFNRCLNLDDNGIHEFLAESCTTKIRPCIHFALHSKFTVDDVLKTFSFLPSFALELCTNTILDTFTSHLSDSDIQIMFDRVASAILDRPNILEAQSQVWITLICKVPHREEELRCAFLTTASTQQKYYISWNDQELTFRLRLPEEAMLLPSIIVSILGRHDIQQGISTISSQIISDTPLHKIGKIIDLYVENANAIREIAENAALPLYVRATAALMFIVHPSGNSDFRPWQDVIVEGCRLSEGSWLLECYVLVVRAVTSLKDTVVKNITNDILDIFRSNYSSRNILDQLLTEWREFSAAPVTSAEVLDSWLKSTSM